MKTFYVKATAVSMEVQRVLPGEAPTAAELLLDLADWILLPASTICEFPGLGDGRPEVHTARGAVAIDFSRRPDAFRFRAVVEGWDYERIVREMY